MILGEKSVIRLGYVDGSRGLTASEKGPVRGQAPRSLGRIVAAGTLTVDGEPSCFASAAIPNQLTARIARLTLGIDKPR
jgi:hypothetical protein